MRFDQNLTNNTAWSVGSFEWGEVGAPHHVPWVFRSDGTVAAEGFWSGTWTADGKDTVKVVIPSPVDDDRFRVVFLSQRWFVAMKRGEPYRLGKLLIDDED